MTVQTTEFGVDVEGSGKEMIRLRVKDNGLLKLHMPGGQTIEFRRDGLSDIRAVLEQAQRHPGVEAMSNAYSFKAMFREDGKVEVDASGATGTIGDSADLFEMIDQAIDAGEGR